MRLIRAAMGPHFLFIHDSASCHYALTTAELLDSENIQHIDWTAKNPDLSPIEDIKDILGRELASGHHPPATTGATRGIGQQSFSISSSEWTDDENPAKQSGVIKCPTKVQIFLDSHESVCVFMSSCASSKLYNNKELWISFLERLHWHTPTLTPWGSYGMIQQSFWNISGRDYIRKTASSLFIAHQCIEI